MEENMTALLEDLWIALYGTNEEVDAITWAEDEN